MPRTALLLALWLVSGAAAGAQGWNDDFDGPELDGRWTWRVTAAGPALSLTERPGWLRIRVPQRDVGFNHWNEPRADDAPQLRTPVPAGDWELEAHLQLQKWDPANHFHLGLVVGLNDAQILAWGPLLGPGIPGGPTTPELRLEPTGTSGYFKLPGNARDVVLRLARAGNTFRAEARRGQGPWERGRDFTFPEAPAFVGLIAKTFSNGPGVAFDVDYIRIGPAGATGRTPEPPAPQAAVRAAAPPAAPATARPAAVPPSLAPAQRPAAAAPPPARVAPSPTAPGALESPDAGAKPAGPGGDPSPETIALGKRLCDLGDRHLREKRYGDAEACYRAVLRLLPASPRAKAGLAKAQRR